jgi:hypothetical protein
MQQEVCLPFFWLPPSDPAGMEDEDAKDERAAFLVRFVLGNDDERLSKTGGTAISFYTKQIVAHRWRVVETMGAMDHHFEPFADRERSLNMTLPLSETPSFRLVSPASSAFQADRDDTRRRQRRPNAFAKRAVVDRLDHHRPGQVKGSRVDRPILRYCQQFGFGQCVPDSLYAFMAHVILIDHGSEVRHSHRGPSALT